MPTRCWRRSTRRVATPRRRWRSSPPPSTASPGSISRRCCRRTTAISPPPPGRWGCTGAPCSASSRSGRYGARRLLRGPAQVDVPARPGNGAGGIGGQVGHQLGHLGGLDQALHGGVLEHDLLDHLLLLHAVELRLVGRSEERRVGKECRSRWSPYP